LLVRLGKYLLLWGLPGLSAIAFIDSAAVPTIAGTDALVLVLAWQRPMQTLFIILAAAVGSTLGSLVLYKVGSAGGEMALSRFSPERRAWVKRKLDRNAFRAVLAAVAAPPPFPTKLVILAAGAFHVSKLRFANGVLAGRLLRYSVVAFLGARFGDQAADVIKQHYATAALILTLLLIAWLLCYWYRSMKKTAISEK
jgi:undecaprenyl-diphosphatase